MMKIEEQYLMNTTYGLNLVVKTRCGKYFQQVHRTLEYNGGGAAHWEEVKGAELDLFLTLLILI